MGVHSIDAYPQIKELLGIPDDEPIFILRAKDKLATLTLYKYLELADSRGCDGQFMENLNICVIEFEDWQEEHWESVKIPD